MLRDEIRQHQERKQLPCGRKKPMESCSIRYCLSNDILLQEPAGRLFREELILLNQDGTANINFTCTQTLNIIWSGA